LDIRESTSENFYGSTIIEDRDRNSLSRNKGKMMTSLDLWSIQMDWALAALEAVEGKLEFTFIE
jgi:hypothetical protein